MATTIVYSDITGGDNDYATLPDWEAATDIDLTAATGTEDRHIAHLFLANSPYVLAGGAAIFAGATTDVNNYREITAQPGNVHDGTADTGARIQNSSAGYYCVYNQENYFRVTKLDLDGNSVVNRAVLISGTVQYALVEDCLIRETSGQGVLVSSTPDHANTIVTVRNCAGFNCAGGFTHGVSGYEDQTIVEYCSAVRVETDGDVGDSGIRYALVTNCAVFHYGPDGGHADYLNLDGGSSNYASHDASGSVPNLTAADQFVDLTDNDMDLHLIAESDLEAAGTPIGGVTTDWACDGDTRDGTNPDIGCDEYVGGAVSSSSGVEVSSSSGVAEDSSSSSSGVAVDSSSSSSGVAEDSSSSSSGVVVDSSSSSSGVVASVIPPTLIQSGQYIGAL